MIKSLKLQNFKGIKEGNIDLEPLSILLGPNNSGKTTILEALFLAPNPFRTVPYVFEGVPNNSALYLLHKLHETLDSQGYLFLIRNYLSDEANIECELDNEIYRLTISTIRQIMYFDTNRSIENRRSEMLEGKEITYFNRAYTNSIGEVRDVYKDLIIENSTLVNSFLLKEAYNYLRTNWVSIVNTGICRKVAKEASELSHDNYLDITIEPFLQNRLSASVYHDDGRRIRLGDIGEGMQNYIVAKIIFNIDNSKILLWDDIESHLNPRIIVNLGNWFSNLIDEGKQVILTTHSIEATRTLAELNEKNVAVYLTKLKNGIFETKKMSYNEFENITNAGIDIRLAERFLL